MRTATPPKDADEQKSLEFPLLDPESVLPQVKTNMQKTTTALQRSLSTIFIGRASPDLLSSITIRAYGVQTPLSQLATVSVVGMQSITVEPYDPSLMKTIIRTIVQSDLGFNPVNQDNMIFMNVPPLNEEYRAQMKKKCKKLGEDTKISIRNIRRSGNDSIKRMEQEKVVSQDEQKRVEIQIQKTTEEYVQKVDKLIERKEKEIMKI